MHVCRSNLFQCYITESILLLIMLTSLHLFSFPLQRFYVATSRQLKRLESVSRSPIYSHFQESVTGASSIRAYGQTDRFIQMSDTKVDYNNIAYYPKVCANRYDNEWIIYNYIIITGFLFASLSQLPNVQNSALLHLQNNFPFSRWLAIRLEFIGNLIILSAATFVVLQRNYPDVLGRINPGLAGLSISYALEVYTLVSVLTDFIAFLDLLYDN